MSTAPEVIQPIVCRGGGGITHRPKRPPVRQFAVFRQSILAIGGLPARTPAFTWHCGLCQAEHVILAYHLGVATSQAGLLTRG